MVIKRAVVFSVVSNIYKQQMKEWQNRDIVLEQVVIRLHTTIYFFLRPWHGRLASKDAQEGVLLYQEQMNPSFPRSIFERLGDFWQALPITLNNDFAMHRET